MATVHFTLNVHSYVHFIVAQVLSNLQTMSHLYCWQLKVTGFCLLFCRVWFGMACLTSIPLLRVVILYPWLCSFQQSQAFFLTIVWKYLWYTSQVTWLVGWLVSLFIQGKPLASDYYSRHAEKLQRRTKYQAAKENSKCIRTMYN